MHYTHFYSLINGCASFQKTWTERLNETEELARKREEQLKMLGLVSDTNDLKAKCMTVWFDAFMFQFLDLL